MAREIQMDNENHTEKKPLSKVTIQPFKQKDQDSVRRLVLGVLSEFGYKYSPEYDLDLENIQSIYLWQAVVKEIARVLKPNGIFYFKEFLKDVFQIPLIGPLYKWIDGPAGLFSEKELKMK